MVQIRISTYIRTARDTLKLHIRRGLSLSTLHANDRATCLSDAQLGKLLAWASVRDYCKPTRLDSDTRRDKTRICSETRGRRTVVMAPPAPVARRVRGRVRETARDVLLRSFCQAKISRSKD